MGLGYKSVFKLIATKPAPGPGPQASIVGSATMGLLYVVENNLWEPPSTAQALITIAQLNGQEGYNGCAHILASICDHITLQRNHDPKI